MFSSVILELQGATFILSKWYKRSELTLRIAILMCGNMLSNAFGSLVASGILDGMEGVLGHAAWRWCVTGPLRNQANVV